MNNEPLVSCIVPVYNVAHYLYGSINSIIDQSYTNLEIILVDDGSIDDSGQLCDEFASKDKRITVIHQPNKGLSAARNAGLDKCTGQLITFIDSDDLVMRNFVLRMVDEYQTGGSDIVMCKFKTDRSRSMYPAVKKQTMNSSTALNLLVSRRLNWHVWNKLFTRKLFDSVRFPEGRIYEDMLTVPKLIESAHSISLIEDCLYEHTIRQGSISTTANKENITEWLYACNYIKEFVLERPQVFNLDSSLETYKGFCGACLDQLMTWLVSVKGKDFNPVLIRFLSDEISKQIQELNDLI